MVLLILLLPTTHYTNKHCLLRAFNAHELGHLSHCMDAWSKYSGPHLKQHTELVWRRWREGERERELLEIGNFKLLVSTRWKPSGPWLNGNPLKISTWSGVSLWAICCLCALLIPWHKVLPKREQHAEVAFGCPSPSNWEGPPNHDKPFFHFVPPLCWQRFY